MRKRPLCWLAVGLMMIIWLLQNIGLSWIWRSWRGPQPDEWAIAKEHVVVSGQVWQQEEQIYQEQVYTFLYLQQSQIKRETKKYPVRKIKCQIFGSQPLLIGRHVTITGQLLLAQKPTNPGEFNQFQYEKGKKIDYHLEGGEVLKVSNEIDKTRIFFSKLQTSVQEILQKIYPERISSILESMLLGKRQDMEYEQKIMYQSAGISHLLAISATHIGMISGAIWGILQWIGVPISISSISVLGVLTFYGSLIGNPATAFRALVMFAILVGGRILGRSYDMLSALGAAAMLLLLDNPDLLWDGGFQMSVTAVLGIGLQSEQKSKMRFFPGGMVWLFTLPIVLWHYFQVSVAGIIVNLVAIPLLPILLGSGGISVILGSIHIGLGSITGIPAYLIVLFYEKVGSFFLKIPYGIWTVGRPPIWTIVIYYCLLMFVLKSKKKSKVILVGILLFLLWAPWTKTDQITMLDVGQGDGFVFRSDGVCGLIDGGSSSRAGVGRYVILPYLKYNGISQIEGIFVTHDDADHINGIEEVLEEAAYGWLEVKYLLMPNWMKENSKGKNLIKLAQKAKISCVYLQAGDQITMGESKIQILYPGEETDGDSNEKSLVFIWENQGIKGLFTGDLPMNREEEILDDLPKCDFLKCGHHGSRESTGSELLQVTQPKYVLISCGKKNRYGHPHQEVLERIKNLGGNIYRTDESGAIEIKIRNRQNKSYRILQNCY